MEVTKLRFVLIRLDEYVERKLMSAETLPLLISAFVSYKEHFTGITVCFSKNISCLNPSASSIVRKNSDLHTVVNASSHGKYIVGKCNNYIVIIIII